MIPTIGAERNFGTTGQGETVKGLQSRLAAGLALSTPSLALAHATEQVVRQGPGLLVTGLWVLANVSYAGMRAQDSQSHNARAVAFLFGLPLSLLTLAVVEEGSERAYGVDLPRRASVAPTDKASKSEVDR